MDFYVHRFKTEDEAVKIANSVDVGLAGINNISFFKDSIKHLSIIFSLFL
jgi:acyl-CoA reductase-like NAD-dependent aldehyde dehydrogenase